MTLFSPYRVGSIELANRMVMAPMTRSRAIGGVANELMRDYYAQRASAGLIVTEGIAPSPNGLGYARIPGIFSREQVRGWRGVTDAVHSRGGRIFAQLMHVGRIAHLHNLPEGARVVAPSAVRAVGTIYTDREGPQPHAMPEAMSDHDLRSARDEYVSASRNAMEAGFDGIELHGANGYLLEQFLHPHTNRRTDGYGGSLEARARFVIETAAATADAIGAERVGIRLSPHSTFNDLAAHGEVEAQYTILAAAVRDLAYVHLVVSPHPSYRATASAIRRAHGGTTMLNGGFDRARAEAALAEGEAELISFGRPFIANPDLVARMAQDTALATPDPSTFYTPGPEGYVDYPAA